MPALSLSTIGVVVTAAITGVVAYGLFDLPWTKSFLLGAVAASTDAAAVFATLRGTRPRPARHGARAGERLQPLAPANLDAAPLTGAPLVRRY